MKSITIGIIVMLSLAVFAFAQETGMKTSPEPAATHPMKKLVQTKAPHIVIVEAVVRTSMDFRGQAQDMERTVSAQGVVIHPSGIVLIPSSAIEGRQRDMPGDLTVRNEVVELKVILPGEDLEYPAQVCTSDTSLGFTYLVMKDLGERTLQAIDLDASAPVDLGHDLVGVTRLQKGYDFAPYYARAEVVGRVEQPMPCWLLAGAFRKPGLPLYDRTGRLVGLVTTVTIPNGEAAPNGERGGRGGGRNRMRPGFTRGLQGGDNQLFLVPPATVKATLPRILEKAQEVIDK